MNIKNIFSSIFYKLRSKDETKVITILAIVILGFGVLISYILYNSALIRQNNQRARYINQEKSKLSTYFQGRFSLYENLLINASGMVSLIKPENISKEDWAKYTESLEVKHRTPALLGVGLVKIIPPNQIVEFEDSMHQQGLTDYKITPDYRRDYYTAIQYISPYNDINKKAYGLDMYTENVRREAMIKSRDSNQVITTSPVLLNQDVGRADGKKPQSVVIYYPIYASSVKDDVATVDQRRASLIGYTYAIARIDDIIANLKGLESSTEYKITDITSSQPEIIKNYNFPDSLNSSSNDVGSEVINIAGRKWQLLVHAKLQNDSIFNYPVVVFMTSLLASMTVAWMVYMYLNRRFRFVREVYKNEVEQTKNDLLALASHQLRTPATGVRQYINMLINGYFGNLTDEQLAIALKAHLSNERQLEVIDQILYVAKADIDQLAMNFEEINLTSLTKDVVDTMEDTIKHKEMIIKFSSNPKEIKCIIDKKYMRMIIENLLSNAIKYSHPKSKIYIKLTKKHKLIKLSIKDNGVGIEKADIEKLFVKFSRIPNALSRKEGGTGLGLFLAKKLAEAHRGDIEVISENSKGSEFILSLPTKFSK